MKDRVVAITGAGRGIGLATARRFAEKGCRLALNHWRTGTKALQEVAGLARENGGDAFLVEADIGRPEEAARFVRESEARFGGIDVLINNAGILRSTPTHEETQANWDEVISVNLGGTWSCLRAALPGMLERGSGRIINVSSELGIIGYPTYAAYCASKGGIIALTKAVAKEVAPRGVLVNSVAPGPVETDMLIHDTIEYNDETREQIPLRRFGRPEEIAAAIEFLAGEGGSFMVGQILSPNGGTAI
ncbi:MAG TPA: 3-oxoacyl-ACP reductase family protein [Rubrobacteraceae bacterium]|nr:3-oxoacyl-ACP reductase family protein [Rubrobacteraceae bacterium]